MKPETLRIVGLIGMMIACLVCWVGVIYAALEVSSIVLNTLHQIVELAQMS